MEKFYKNISLLLGAAIFICCIGTTFLWCFSYNSWTLREQLKLWSPLFLEINLIAIVIGACIACLSFFKKYSLAAVRNKFPGRIWLLLGAILAAGCVLVCFIAPREHRIYYDEDIYQNIGQTIAYTKGAGVSFEGNYPDSLRNFWKRFIGSTGMCNDGKNEYGEYSCLRLEYNKEPNGWPYVLSVVYRLFGVHELASFLTNNALFVLSLAAVFFIGYFLFEDYYAALYAALILCCTPEFIIWSNTVAVEPSAACFPALAVLATLFYLKTRTASSLFLAATISAFAIQFRPEAIMICAVIGLLVIFRGMDELRKGKFYLLASLFFIFVIPLFVHLYSVKDMGWGSSGAKFSLDFFRGNFNVNALFYLMNMRFPLIFTILFFLGIFLKSAGNGSYQWKEKLVVLVWFLLFWGIFLFFYAGSYNYGADVRFSLLSAVPIALLAGNGAAMLGGHLQKKFNIPGIRIILTAVIIIFFISFLPFVRAITQEAWAARADHKYALEMVKLLPEDSVVFTHNPNMFLLWGKNAAQTSLATEQRGYFNGFFSRYKGGVYFHYNFWCNVNDPLQTSFCTYILNSYNCTELVRYKLENYEYALYKVEKK